MIIIIDDEPEIYLKLIHNEISDFYEISNYGKIRNKETGKVLKSFIDRYGYERISLRTKIKTDKKYFIHRLVSFTFIGDPIDNNYVVNHKDSVRNHNYYKNLEWCSHKDNSIHGFKHGKKKIHYGLNTKYDIELIKQICFMISKGHPTSEIINELGYNHHKNRRKIKNLIVDIRSNKSHKHILKEFI